MEYREFGKTGIKLSGLGFGVNRFEVASENNIDEIIEAANIIVKAAEYGINYIDVARNYSNGMAFPIVRKALEIIPDNKKLHICLKMMLHHTDKTKEGALSSIKEQLRDLGLSQADFCFVQALKSYQEYELVMASGGIYEGMLEAKSQGLINHICLSSHATVEETLKFMEDGCFEGLTISYHLMNATGMQLILDRAGELGIGIMTMNSLAGGVIPQNPHLFAKQSQSVEEVCKFALRFIYAHPQITCVLSGMHTLKELECNVQAIEGMQQFDAGTVTLEAEEMFRRNGLCTGCDYCRGCPKEIPIKSIMSSYNAIYLDNKVYADFYKRESEELLDEIRLTQEMMRSGIAFPIEAENPCISCYACEKKCTQSLPIVDRIQSVYKKMEQNIADRKQLKKRLEKLFLSDYKKVVFYPNCATTNTIIDEYCNMFGQPEFKIYIADRNEKLHGKTNPVKGVQAEIIGVDSIIDVMPDYILVTHYILQDILIENVKHFRDCGIGVETLYNENDVPLVYLGG